MNQLFPDIYSFITIRKEQLGGFCFNPYLLTEITLNQEEMAIVKLCNGEYSREEIIAIMAQDFPISQNHVAIIVDNTLNRLDQYYAINWKSEKKERHADANVKRSIAIPDMHDLQGTARNYFSAPLSLIFELTYKCNFSCKHCLVDAGRATSDELSFDEITTILEQLKEMKVFSVNFGGGEPLLRPDFFEIMKYASDLNLGIYLSTNGYLITESVLEKLADIKTFSLQISVDGLESTHDTFRGKQGSFKKAIWALKEFSERGYHTTMSTMILKTNLDELESLIELCASSGISSFKLSTFMPAGRGNINFNKYRLTDSELRKVGERMIIAQNKYHDKLFIDNKATYPWLFQNKANLPITHERNFNIGCSAARSSIVISPTGEVYPCPFLHQFSAGNLREKTLSDIWENSEAFSIFRQLNISQLKGKCRSCVFVPAECQGGCRAASFLKTGDLFAEDPFCWYKSS